MVSEATLSESILSLASAIAEKDVTSQGNGTKAKALEVLSAVLSGKGAAEGDDALYAITQFAQMKSTDTVAAAGAIAEYGEGYVKPSGTISITENGEGIDVAQYATADVSVSGGGGGDFTTAHVTVTSNADVSGSDFHVCTFTERGEMAFSAPSPVGSGTTLEFDAILYKGGAAMMVNAIVTATSGAIQQMRVGSYLITGDCSITVS